MLSPPIVFSTLLPRPPIFTLFPYTTLFRSAPFGQQPLCELVVGMVLHFRIEHFFYRRMRGEEGDDLPRALRSEEHTSELQSHSDLVCRLLLEKKNTP